MPTQIPATGRPASTRSRKRVVEPVARESGRRALDVSDAGDQRERRLADDAAGRS